MPNWDQKSHLTIERSPAGWLVVHRASSEPPFPRSLPNAQTSGSADDDLHTAVLRLTHARAGGNKPVCVAEALDRNGILRHAVLDQLGLHRRGATHRQALV